MTLFLVLFGVTFITLAMLAVAPRRADQAGAGQGFLGDPIGFAAKGLLRVVTWLASGLTAYGLAFGYAGPSASILMKSREGGPVSPGQADGLWLPGSASP